MNFKHGLVQGTKVLTAISWQCFLTWTPGRELLWRTGVQHNMIPWPIKVKEQHGWSKATTSTQHFACVAVLIWYKTLCPIQLYLQWSGPSTLFACSISSISVLILWVSTEWISLTDRHLFIYKLITQLIGTNLCLLYVRTICYFTCHSFAQILATVYHTKLSCITMACEIAYSYNI